MDQAAPTPKPSPWSLTPSEHEAGPPRLSAFVKEARPASFSLASSRNARLIEGLRRRIHGIERHVPESPRSNRHVPWTVGAADADMCLGPSGLNTQAVHEIKPGSARASATAASMGFALRLAARHLLLLKAAHPDSPPPRILWCISRTSTYETGELYIPGLSAFGLEPASFLIVETVRASEMLWAMEEGLKSGGLALVIGHLTGTAGRIGLTPARRLSLAAEQSGTPCLLLTPEGAPPAAATSTRWRIDTAPSAAHRFDARAPGAGRITVTLERCQHYLSGDPLSFVLEWPHARGAEAHRIPVAAALAHRTVDASQPKRRTG